MGGLDKTCIIFLFLLFLQVYVYCQVNNATNIDRNFIYEVVPYNTEHRIIVNSQTEHVLEFNETNVDLRKYPTRVHVSTNEDLSLEHPVFITATQQKGVSSWQLPVMSPETKPYYSMARTLCPHDAGSNVTNENRPLIHITTSNPDNVPIDIELNRVTNFYVELNKTVEVNVSHTSPQLFYFSFSDDNVNHTNHLGVTRLNYTVPKSVILMIDSPDNISAIVSIQNSSCPVFDQEQEVVYRGYHFTMIDKGGITITQSMFPVGFYIVLIVKENDDDDDYPDGIAATDPNRIKTFRFRVIPTISYKEYLIAALCTLAIIFTFYVFGVLLQYCACYWKENIEILEPIPTTSHNVEAAGDHEPIINRQDSMSDTESESSAQLQRALTVADLCKARPTQQSKRSDRYLWSATTVAVVYLLPVVQLLVTYQYMVYQSGDQDVCYYNFLCAHPLGWLTDFNHFFSNVGYAALGLLFMLQVWRRQMGKPSQEFGIPQHHGLFYSMGLALIMEGVLSGCYHLCPNKMNFQFDSSFMYVIAVLCMVKLYQNRHPDVNARAHSTFLLLAAIMAIGVYGIMYPSVYFWAVFTVLHLLTCFLLTLKIYYVGKLKLEVRMLGAAWGAVRTLGRGALVPEPHYRARAALLAVANIANWTLAIHGQYEHNKDFARHLLAILMGNAILYTLFYMIMKVIHRERIGVYVWLYLILAHAAWFTALWLFLDAKTKWSETPAASRRHNAVCTAFNFYDSHDLWHLCSAAALFLSFNLLLSIDDGLDRVPRNTIPVF